MNRLQMKISVIELPEMIGKQEELEQKKEYEWWIEENNNNNHKAALALVIH